MSVPGVPVSSSKIKYKTKMDIVSDELSESTVRIGSDSETSSHKSDDFEELQKLVDTDTSNDSRPSEEETFPETVTVLHLKGTNTKIYLIGTAHFSEDSINDVTKVIRSVQPQAVVLELCSSRTSILSYDEETLLHEAKTIDLDKIRSSIKSNGVFNGVMYLLFLNMSAYITKEMGMAPGGEFRAACREAAKLKSHIHLGDRPIQITIKRALSKLSWYQTFKLGWNLATSKEPISKEEIEKCKHEDILEQLISQLSGEYPGLGHVFVQERNTFLTHSLQVVARNTTELYPEENVKVVGVVGIGHISGIKELWDTNQSPNIAAVMEIPPPSLSSKIFKVSFRISLFAVGGYLVYRYVPVPNIVKDSYRNVVTKVVSSLNM